MPEKAPKTKYTSVIYVHGIGSQRRYEETSRLIDSLDGYVGNLYRAGKTPERLTNIKVRVEPFHAGEGAPPVIGYVRTVHESGVSRKAVRFYEVYWAPVMAEQRSPWRVVKWLFSQTLRPWHTMLSPWRERQRLRRASLVAMLDPGEPRPTGVEDRDFGHLIRLYDSFEGLSAQRDHGTGRFSEFLALIATEFANRPETALRCQRLARAWRKDYLFTEARNAFNLLTVALALVLLGIGSLAGLSALLTTLVTVPAVSGTLTAMGITADLGWSTVLGVAVTLASFFGLSKTLTDYLGDVESWATYQETDLRNVARNKVLENCIDVLTHVLSDSGCDRVVVVAHSLGTSIAHDALLVLTRRNRATNISDPVEGPVPLKKIEHFITMGSPIDKIEYFFESYASASHRYKRVVEELRGDIGREPFGKKGKPHIHWINFWDQGDAISGPLQSPASSKPTLNRVDNQQVTSYHFPSTAASHAGYFTHKTVIETIFAAIYHRKYSFVSSEQPKKFGENCLASDAPKDNRIWYLRAAVLFPWLVATGFVCSVLGAKPAAHAIWWGAAGIGVILAICWIASAFIGHRQPI